MDAKKTGAYLAMLRKGMGLTQQEVAERLGVSNKTVSKWESGGGFPDITVLPALAALYGVTADELLAGESRPGKMERRAPSEVENYLHRREEFRFRGVAAVAALCLAAGCVFGDRPLLALMPAAAILAVWAGWGVCRREALGTRIRVLLPLTAVGVYLLLRRFAPWVLLGDLLREQEIAQYVWIFSTARERLLWSACLVALPVLYALGRLAVRQWGGESRLLERPAFWTLAAGWGLSVLVDILWWVRVWPLGWAYALVESDHPSRLQKAFGAYRVLDEPLGWLRRTVIAGALVALAVLALRRKALAERAKK